MSPHGPGCSSLGNPTLGTPYVVSLGLLGNGDDGTNCINNAAETGVCCLDTPPTGSCIAEVPWRCGVQGGINSPNPNTVCFLNPFGGCNCGPDSGNCTDVLGNGTPGCELLTCCGIVCLNDSFCCSDEWDSSCAFFAADQIACLLCQSVANCQPASADGNNGIVAAGSDVDSDSLHAANFVPAAGGSITETCWWGLYLDGVAGLECSAAFGNNDVFTVTYYLNSDVGGNPGIPGALHAGPFTISAANANLDKQATGRTIGVGGFDDEIGEFIYTATHAAVPVNGGQCYWLEVQNNTTGLADCLWCRAFTGGARVLPQGSSLVLSAGPLQSSSAGASTERPQADCK